MAANMHVLYHGMSCCLSKTAGQLQVPQTIGVETVKHAETLVMHIMQQMGTLQKVRVFCMPACLN